MNVQLVKAMFALVPVSMVAFGAAISLLKKKTFGSLLQLAGAGCFVVVALTHACEGLRLFWWMGWGEEHSVGHYIDLLSALLGLALFSLGYLFDALSIADDLPRRRE